MRTKQGRVFGVNPWVGLLAVVGLLLAACGEKNQPQPAQSNNPPAVTATTSAPAAAVPPTNEPAQAAALPYPDQTLEQLVLRANRAYVTNRLVAPAGDNALEFFVAIQERDSNHQGAQEALVDLFPIVVNAIEAAIKGNDLIEAGRLLGLLEKSMPSSLALAKLHDKLEQRKRWLAEQERIAANPPPVPSAPPANADRVATVTASAPANAGEEAPSDNSAANGGNAESGASSSAADREPEPQPADTAATASAEQDGPADSGGSQNETDAVANEPAARSAPASGDYVGPAVLSQASPVYPPKARQQRIEGWVQLEFTVDLSGRARNIRVMDAAPRGVFNVAAQRALQRWKFKPAERNGKPEVARSQTRMSFKLS